MLPMSTEPEYQCQLCCDMFVVHPRKDDGTVDYTRIVNCKCVEAKIAQQKKKALINWCELPVKTEYFTFENYKVFPEVKKAYDAALALAQRTLPETFLTLMGPSDNGKTHLLIAICRNWLSQGKLARYAFVPLLLDELRAGFNQNSDGSYEDRWQKFLNVPLLALDDLGTENPTPWAQEHLDTLIDYRMVQGLATVVTTNLVFEKLSSRIGSRLQRAGLIVGLSAKPYSQRKK